MCESVETTLGLSLKKVRKLLRMKPTRTISGVAPITIFTKPYPCPGNCIFCPTQENMPKSYLREEPGAMRAESLKFDPYEQVKLRVRALKNIGHNTDKIELIISGGTWSFYPKDYREWFIEQAFKALNKLPKDSGQNLRKLHQLNETVRHRCVGLAIETRPDYIDKKEIKHLRKLGVTKVQLGIQTLDDNVLKLNNRGHSSDESREAINLLRLAGFKIHIHWMANLYGSNIEKDYLDFQKLFCDKSIMPDELKIYPCSVLTGTKLYSLMKEGKYKPYTENDLIKLLVKCKTHIPKYSRVSRLVRDIPSQLIKGGSQKTNLRQLVQSRMKQEGLKCNCIRCREIRNGKFSPEALKYKSFDYETAVSKEMFLSYVVNDRIVGFLRLTIPKKSYSRKHFIEELRDSAIIREIHIYGRALKIGDDSESQHLGLGEKLIKKAEQIAAEIGFTKLAVISAIGTRGYYRKNGFKDGELYQYKML